jgi:hypothetical protein
MDQGGVLWVVIDVALVVVLGGAILYGIGMWRKRYQDPAVKQVRDDATEDLYKRTDDR